MKIKSSKLETLIKEEMKIFFENHGTFPVEEEIEEVNEGKSDLNIMYQHLSRHLGPEKLLEIIVSNINPRALRDVFVALIKSYNIKI